MMSKASQIVHKLPCIIHLDIVIRAAIGLGIFRTDYFSFLNAHGITCRIETTKCNIIVFVLCKINLKLTAEALCALYHKLNADYYGDDVVIDREIDFEWERIPHFYYDFYVFQYATGFSAAIALSRRILREGEPAVKDYLKFLSSGCSTDPISLLKIAGVDLTSPEVVENAMKVFDETIDELDAIL